MRRGRKKTSNFSKIIRPTEMERLYACVAVRLVHTRISGLNSLFSLHIYAYSLETHAGKIFPSENIHGHGVMWIRAEYHFYSNRLTTFVTNYLRPERCRRTTKVIFLLWGTLGQPNFLFYLRISSTDWLGLSKLYIQRKSIGSGFAENYKSMEEVLKINLED